MKVRNVTRNESYEFASYAQMLRMYQVAAAVPPTGWQRFWRVAPILINFVREVRRLVPPGGAA